MNPSRWWKTVLALAALVLFASACGDSNDDLGSFLEATNQASQSSQDDLDAELEEFGEIINQVQGAGGGGTLVWDGVEYPIDSVICTGSGEQLEAGTASDSGFRVLISAKSGGGFDPQILDPEFRQWFDGDKVDAATRDQVSYDGQTFTAPTNTWWNNQDDRTVQASFTFDCP